MEVNFSKPLLSKFRFHRRVRHIKYEGIHLVYFAYGSYGHRTDSCLAKETSAREASPVPPLGVASMDIGGGSTHHSLDSHKGQAPSVASSGKRNLAVVADRFGLWMLAKKSRHTFPHPAGAPSTAKPVVLAISSNHG